MAICKSTGEQTYVSMALDLAESLLSNNFCGEARILLRETIPVLQLKAGLDDSRSLMGRWHYAQAIYMDDEADLNDFLKAEALLEDTRARARRTLGDAHPSAPNIKKSLIEVQAKIARVRASPSGAGSGLSGLGALVDALSRTAAR